MICFEKTTTVEWREIEKARDRLEGIAQHTLVLRSRQFDNYAGCFAFFKMENMQRTGSVKFRGAFNFIKARVDEERIESIITYSSGNHGQAVALSAKLLGLRCTVVMPEEAPSLKVAAVKEYGASVIPYNSYREDPLEICKAFSRDQNALLVPHTEDLLIAAGEATAIAEFLEEVHDLDILMVPFECGELLSVCASAAKNLNPRIKVYGVDLRSPNLLRTEPTPGKNTDLEIDLEIPGGEIGSTLDQGLITGLLAVSETELIDTQVFLLHRMKILADPAGAAAAAALRFKKAEFSRKRVGVMLTAGNADLSKLSLSVKRETLLPDKDAEKPSYTIECFSCKESYDALDTVWCNCLTNERSLVCPRCLNCFCRAPRPYIERFWSDAPQVLWDRKMQENEENFQLKSNPEPWEAKRPLVLVVDDSRAVQRMACHMIQKLGFGTIHARNGEQGFELAKKYVPDMIITDALMPRMDGREMCKRLKEFPATSKIKVVVTTALYTQSKYRSEAFRTFHVDEYLSKPLSFGELQRILQKYLA